MNNMEALMNGQFEQIRRIIISGVICDGMAAEFLNQLTQLEYSDVGVPINVYINSPGGAVDSALGMVDMLTTCSCPIRTIGWGQVSSAAILLLAAGDKGNRIVAPNTTTLLHQVSTSMMGNTTELDNEVKEVQRLQEVYNKMLSKYTGRPIKQIAKDMSQNKYMGADQVIEYGIADKILSVRKVGKITISSPKAKKLREGK
jgi:ATP-dependent Clp protease protease subunit